MPRNRLDSMEDENTLLVGFYNDHLLVILVVPIKTGRNLSIQILRRVWGERTSRCVLWVNDEIPPTMEI